MLSRRHLALGLTGALAPLPAFAQDPPRDPDTEEGQSLRTGQDRYDRLTIPVHVGDSGPYQFVVDTGADRSVLSLELAQELGLQPGRNVMVHGITGSELTPTVLAPRLTLGKVVLNGLDLPVMSRERLGVDGLLGVDALQRRRLVMDFRERRLEILPASGAFYPGSNKREAYVPAKDRFGRLVVIDAAANGAQVSAFVDSGAGMSIVNRALAEAIQARGGWRDDARSIPVLGVTSQTLVGHVRTLESLRLGGLRFHDVPVIVSDLHLFEQWGMGAKPTVLLGVNVLRLFSRVEVDYGRKRMMFQVGADPQVWLA